MADLPSAHLVAGLALNPGANEASLDQVEEALSVILPTDYKDFMRHANGGEGWVGESYLVLDPIEELPSFNEAYRETNPNLPLIIFASDGAGTAYVFDRESPPMRIMAVDLVVLDRHEAQPFGVNFEDFLQHLYTSAE